MQANDRKHAPTVAPAFAIELYYDWRSGKTVDELARQTDIPRDRIAQRIRAAQALLEAPRHPEPQP